MRNAGQTAPPQSLHATTPRIGEPFARRVIGRVFNRVVQLVAVPGVHDTQCGFKLFSAAAVVGLFPYLTIKGFAFDVEILFLARHGGFVIQKSGSCGSVGVIVA